jgi:hypothetical protein
MSASYEVYLLAPDADYVLDYFDSGYSADVAGTGRARKSFGSLEYTNVVGDVGAFNISLPYPQFDISKARKDSRLVVWRKPPGGARYLDFVGLVRSDPTPEIYQRGSELYSILRGVSYNHILKRRVVAYRVDEAGFWHSGAADNVMKDFVYENLGAGAVGARDITAQGFTIQSQTTLGTACDRQASFNNLLETLQAVSDDSRTVESTCIYFGMVPLNNGWQMEFRTNPRQWGNDHRHPSGPGAVTGVNGPVVLSLNRQNIDNASFVNNSIDEITMVYGLGQGEGVARAIVTATDLGRAGMSPFNLIEGVVNANNSSPIGDVLAAAQALLRAGRPRRSFSASIVSTPGTIYGLHWGFGDYVTTEFLGNIMDCRIEAVTVRIADSDENITAQIRSES